MIALRICTTEAANPKREVDTLTNLRVAFMNLVQDESGQDLIEYALVAGLIGLGSIALLTSIGGSVAAIFTKVSAALTTAAGS